MDALIGLVILVVVGYFAIIIGMVVAQVLFVIGVLFIGVPIHYLSIICKETIKTIKTILRLIRKGLVHLYESVRSRLGQ